MTEICEDGWPAFDQSSPAIHVCQDRYSLAATRTKVNFILNKDPTCRGFGRTSEVSSLRGQGLLSRQNASLIVANRQMLIYSMKDLHLRVILQNGEAMYKLNVPDHRGVQFADLAIPAKASQGNLFMVGLDDGGYLHIFHSEFADMDTMNEGQSVGVVASEGLDLPIRVLPHPTEEQVVFIVWLDRVRKLKLNPNDWADGVWEATYPQTTTPVLRVNDDIGDIEDICFSNDGEYIFVLGSSKVVAVFSRTGQVLQKFDISSKLGYRDFSSIRIMASDAAGFELHSRTCPEMLLLVGDQGRRVVAVNIDKGANEEILTNMLQSVWIDFEVPQAPPDAIGNWVLKKKYEVKVDASQLTTVLIGCSTLLESFALPLATGWTPEKGLPFPYLQVLGNGMPVHELFTLTGAALKKSGEAPKEALLLFSGRNFQRQKAGGAIGLGCKIQIQELVVKRTAPTEAKDPTRERQNAAASPPKASVAKPPPPTVAPFSAEARGTVAAPKLPPGLAPPISEDTDNRRTDAWWFPEATTGLEEDGRAAAKAAAAKAHAAAIAAAAATAKAVAKAAGPASPAAPPPFAEPEPTASDSAEADDTNERYGAGNAAINGALGGIGADDDEGQDGLDGQTPSPTAAAEGSSAAAAAAGSAAKQDVDWGSVKRIGASFVKGLQKKRGVLAEKIAQEVATFVAEQQAAGQESDVQAEIAMLEEILSKLKQVKASQEVSSEALQAVKQQATDRWAEATKSAVASLMQKELGRISEGVASSFAEQLGKNSQFSEALLGAVRYSNAAASKKTLEAFRAPREMMPVVTSALSEALREAMEPVFRAELRKHFLNDLTPLAGSHLEEMLKSFKVRINDCLERIAVEHEEAAKRLGEELAPVVQEELQRAQEMLALAHKRHAGAATNHLTDQQLSALAKAMNAEVVQPLQTRIRDLTAQVKELQAKAKALESKWAASRASAAAVEESPITQTRSKLASLARQGKVSEAFQQAIKCHTPSEDCIWSLCEAIGNIETVTGAVDEFTKLAVVAAIAELLATNSPILASRRKLATDWVKELWLALDLSDSSVSSYAPLACNRLNSHLEKIEAHAEEEEKSSVRFLKRVVDQATRLLAGK